MNIEVKDLLPKIQAASSVLKRYVVFIFILTVLGLYTFLVLRVNLLAQAEPGEDAVMEKLQTVQRPQIDQNALTKIEQLQAQNIEVRTLFKQARENPFNE